MKIIEKLKDVAVFRDSHDRQKIGATKGTIVTLIEHGGQRYVEKLWLSWDWVFDADYEYRHDLRVMSAKGRVFVTHGVSETSRKTSVMQGTYAHLHAPHAVHDAHQFSYL
jgi:hypothetical protein